MSKYKVFVSLFTHFEIRANFRAKTRFERENEENSEMSYSGLSLHSMVAEMCQYSMSLICVWWFPHIDSKIQIYFILLNTFDKVVAKFDKFALIRIRFSPTFMKQRRQYSFDNSRNIHSMIRTKFIRWFEQDSFDDSNKMQSIIQAFIYLFHFTGQDLLPRGKEHNRTPRSPTGCPTSPTPPSHTKDSHSTGITLLLYE